MSNDLMIPEGNIPAHILALGTAAVAADNEAALAGVSTGMPPRIKLNGTKFALVDADGTEKPFPASKLIIGPDENQYMPVVVLKAKPNLTKSFYLKKYSKDEEGASPDCWSDDGVRPAPGVLAPLADACASCPKNAFGTGTDADGNPTKGKACVDTKILAVYVPNFGVFSLRIPPASLKNFGGFVKKLTSSNIPLTAITMLLGFDPAASFPVLIFQFGGFVKEGALAKLQAMATTPEVKEIVGDGTAPKAIAAPAHAPKPASEETIDVPAGPTEEEIKAAEAEKKKAEAAAKRKAAAEKKKAEEEAAKAAAAKAADLDLGLDDGIDEPAPQEEVSAPTGPSDDELAAELGL